MTSNLANIPVLQSMFEQDIEQRISRHLAKQEQLREDSWRTANAFAREGYVKLTDFVPTDVKQMITNEASALLRNFSKRKDIAIKETGNSKRSMSNVAQKAISQFGTAIPALYKSPSLRKILGEIARDVLIDCPWEEENYIITRQEKAGDTHGWHWGDYAYTVIWILECPPIEYGGMLQCIPHTAWNKDNPRVHEHLVDGTIKTYTHQTGDLYFLKSDTTLHRTVPLTKDCTRIILNTCWDSGSNPNLSATHETMKNLFE